MTQSFQTIQKTFVDAIKDPQTFCDTDADHIRRMKIYQSLFFNNIDNFVSTGFPVLKSIVVKQYGEKDGRVLCVSFLLSTNAALLILLK